MEGTPLFAVEIRLVESNEAALTTRITSIQRWLSNRGFEPRTFGYTFFDGGVVLRVDFNHESQAVAFADKFSRLGAYFDGSERGRRAGTWSRKDGPKNEPKHGQKGYDQHEQSCTHQPVSPLSDIPSQSATRISPPL